MNNEIAVRTNKGEYFPGETVFGVVYLNVCRPTEATGIQVTFKGTELCTYKYESEGEQQELTSEAIHVDFTGVSLYSQDECFQFGSYAFPFKFELAKDIPGTFFCSASTEATSWEVNISYSIQTSAFGADSMEATQPVVIFETSEEDMRVGLMGTAVDYCWQVSRLPRRKIHLTAKLLENYVESGSNLQLRLIVTNTSKVTVTGFKVMLLRYLKLDMAVLETSKKAMVANMVFDNDDVYICPEGGPHVYAQHSSVLIP